MWLRLRHLLTRCIPPFPFTQLPWLFLIRFVYGWDTWNGDLRSAPLRQRHTRADTIHLCQLLQARVPPLQPELC